MIERRKSLRFLITLKVQTKKENKENCFGLIKDFSRGGIRAVFDDFDFNINSFVDLEIQRLSKDVFIPAIGEVVWKRPSEGRCEVGLRFKEFSPEAKSEILAHGYKKLLEDSA